MSSRPLRTTRGNLSYREQVAPLDLDSDDDYNQYDQYDDNVEDEDAEESVDHLSEDDSDPDVANDDVRDDDAQESDPEFSEGEADIDLTGVKDNGDENDIPAPDSDDDSTEKAKHTITASRNRKRSATNNDGQPISKRQKVKAEPDPNPRSFANPPNPLNSFNYDNSLDFKSPPLITTAQIFGDLTTRAHQHASGNLKKFCDAFSRTPLKVLTFCSGTESPILGLKMFQKELVSQFGMNFLLSHEGSAEIQPEKAAYIQRNFPSKVILRDIIEFVLAPEDSADDLLLTTMYGGKVPVPRGIDILVAGFCCDDFSTLNNVRKSLQEKGESGDTFFALLAYMEKYHPRMAVLENVIGAPWVAKYKKNGDRIFDKKKGHIQDQSIADYLSDAGYYTIFVRVDTKDFYLPQTRIRGYMVCILKSAISREVFEEKKVEFGELMVNLKRPASAPVEAFLFPSDDPALKALHIESKGDRKPVAWDKCSMLHQKYRKDLGLGSKNPLTHIKPDGSAEMPDYYVRPSNATERVKDSLDIAHMRNLQRGFDDRYLNRQLELSQNVYRVEDTVRFGVQQCLTPTNIAFSTFQGRRLTGAEAAYLQGIDLGQVIVTNMTESLLHDMDGNAMSSPVVTAVAIATVVTFRSVLRIKGREVVEVEPESVPSAEGQDFLLVFQAPSHAYTPVSVKKITGLALRTIRLCLCEGRHDTLATHFQRCRECHHITCEKHGKHPKHKNEKIAQHLIQERLNPLELEDVIKDAVPMVIDLVGLLTTKAHEFLCQLKKFATSKDFTTWSGILNAFYGALVSTVYFRCIRRTDVWTVTWDSAASILKLIIRANSVEWRLYANVSTEPLGSQVGQYLRQYPIARMFPNGKDLVEGTWAFWCPVEKIFEATITSSGPLIPTYKNACGLVNNLNELNQSNIELQVKNYDPKYFDMEIRGHYIASPDCGQAFNSMHLRKSEAVGQKPLGLFFSHDLLAGHPAEHSFVLSSDFERKDWGDYPVVAGRLSSSWRQPIIDGGNANASEALAPGADSSTQEDKAGVVDEIKIVVNGRFVDLGSNALALTGPIFEYQHLPRDVGHLSLSCGHGFMVFGCRGGLIEKLTFAFPSDVWNIITQGDFTHFWHELQWVVLRHLKIKGHKEADEIWHPFADHVNSCVSCAPPRPPLIWKLNRKLKNVPVEHPEHAANWEAALKRRPAPLKVMFRVDKLGAIDIRVSMDPATLTHRAKALLVGNDELSEVDLSWRLVTDDGRHRKPELPPLTLLSNDDVEEARQPFSEYNLRPEQLRVLAWMKKQEAEGAKFSEEEIVEALVPEIGYRAEGRAAREVTRRGGILAQDVGFGKTVVVLALIKERPEPSPEEATQDSVEIPAGKIPTQATLIIMPPHLVKQWKSEIEKFVPELLENILIIENPNHFAKITIKDIQKAKIVLVSWGVTNKIKYRKLLATISGIVEPVDNPGPREFDAWYKNAIESLKGSVEKLRNDPKGLVSYLQAKWEANLEAAKSADVRVPSKHITGASYVNSDQRKTAGSKKKKPPPTPEAQSFEHPSIEFKEGGDWKTMINAILELFYWLRVIIDEHTYSDGLIGVVLSHILAKYYWLLSGTPALGGHGDIKALASLLRINLGVDDLTGLRPDIFKQKTSEYTKTELFLAHQELHSVQWKEHRHQLCQIFLHRFCRKDLNNVDHIPMRMIYWLIDQSPSEVAIYVELVQHVAATEFQIVRSSNKTGDRAKTINSVVHGTGDAKPALFMRASHFTVDGYNIQDAADALQIVISNRHAELNDIKASIQEQLKKTFWLHMEVDREHREEQKPACDYYTNLKERFKDNTIGDVGSAKFATKLTDMAPDQYKENDWKLFYRALGSSADGANSLPEYPDGNNQTHGVAHITKMAFELRSAVTQLNKLVAQFVRQRRSLRFVRNIAAIQGPHNLSCAHCGIANLQPTDGKLMADCGHYLCSTCAKSDECPVAGCTGHNREYQKLNGSIFGTTASDSCSSHGTKMDAIVKLIKTFAAKKELGLIFCQYSTTTDQLVEALKAARIPYADLRKEATSSKILEHFQNRTAPKGQKVAVVLLLNIGDANASGSNLTVASNIVVLQPYYTFGENAQDRYDAAMTQAIGRARRNGQTKEVKVYHFLTTRTIDIDYFEARNNVILERYSKNPERGVNRPVTNGSNWNTQLGTHFAKIMKFDGAKRKDH